MFAAYLRCARNLNLESELLDTGDGYASVLFRGPDAKKFLAEAGRHCVQRVSGGNRQTSIVTVAVLPLPSTPKPLDLKDVEFVAQRGHGKGGQNQAKVSSACRAVHRPTGTEVFINGRDFHQNKRRALEILSARIAEATDARLHHSQNALRQAQVRGSGRGDKDRTYRFFDNVAVDHRTGRKVQNLARIMKGDFGLLW